MAVQNVNKERIRRLISLAPGLHLRAVQRIAGLSFSSTRYHVQVLQKSGEVVRAEEGGYSRLYPKGIDQSDRILYSLVDNATDRTMLSCMVQTPRISFRELCAQTGRAKSTISRHLSLLIEVGAVKECDHVQNPHEYELVDPNKIRAMITTRDSKLLAKVTDRFIDLWDF